MSIIWPPILPAPKAGDFKESTDPMVARSKSDVGIEPVRALFYGAAVRRYNFSVILQSSIVDPGTGLDQIATLKNFFEVVCLGGVNDFQFTHPETNQTVTVTWDAEPQYSVVGGVGNTQFWQAACSLVQRN